MTASAEASGHLIVKDDASLRTIVAFLWSEVAIVAAAAMALAALLGWLLAEMLVAMLQHVFDPPPDRLAVPWLYLAGLFGAAASGGQSAKSGTLGGGGPKASAA